MKTEQQRIAIAEACEWEVHLPNYPQDLNACHEARKTIITTNELRVKYLNTLRAVVSRRCPTNKTGASLVTDYDLVDAEAWEHAEALVKVSGKWVALT